MKYLLLILLIFITTNCSKNKTVLICGDHACINKAEAEQYFEENLTIEVKIIDKKIKKELNLIELNLEESLNGKKSVLLNTKKNKKKELKKLSNNEIINIKKNIKEKKKVKRLAKKTLKEKTIVKNKKDNEIKSKIKFSTKKKQRKKVVDVCTILDKCTIDEISKYLLKQNKKKGFPDIMLR